MPHKLLIRLKNNAVDTPSFDWTIIFDDGTTQSGTDKSSEELTKFAVTAQQIMVLVPTMDTLLTQVKLPKLSYPRLVKAIPFALEEQIAEDPSTLHFAIGTQVSGQPLPVIVVSKDKMTAWQHILSTLLKNAHSQVKVLLPDVLALPWQPESFHILIDQQFALVRTNQCAGFTIEKESLFQVLKLLLKRQDQPRPQFIQLYNTTSNDLFTKEEIDSLGIPIQTAPISANALTLMSSVWEAPAPLNLLQGSYAPAKKKITMEQWIWTGFAIAAAWLVFLTLVDITQFLILHWERNVLNNEMRQIYTMVYPNTPIPEHPKMSMQNDLNNLRANRSESTFIRIVSTVAPRFVSFTELGLMLDAATYRDNQLILQVEAKDSALLDKFRQSLESIGLNVVMDNAERNPNGLVETRLTIEELT